MDNNNVATPQPASTLTPQGNSGGTPTQAANPTGVGTPVMDPSKTVPATPGQVQPAAGASAAMTPQPAQPLDQAAQAKGDQDPSAKKGLIKVIVIGLVIVVFIGLVGLIVSRLG